MISSDIYLISSPICVAAKSIISVLLMSQHYSSVHMYHTSHQSEWSLLKNLEEYYQRTYFQGRNRDVDIKNRLMNIIGEGRGEMN